jgi:hypothetical protein
MAMWGFGQDLMANLGYLRQKPEKHRNNQILG